MDEQPNLSLISPDNLLTFFWITVNHCKYHEGAGLKILPQPSDENIFIVLLLNKTIKHHPIIQRKKHEIEKIKCQL